MSGDRLGEVHVQVGTSVELLSARVGQHTALLEVAGTGHIAHILIATRYVDALPVLEARLVSQVIPVGVGMSVGIGAVVKLLDVLVGEGRRLARAGQGHIVIGSVLARAHAVHQSRGIGETIIAVVRNTGLSVLTTLRSDEDHTVGSLRTVDGGRCGVLQYGDTLNILRVERVDIAGLHTIHEDIGAGVVERTHTTHADATAVHTGSTGCSRHGDTGHEALQTGGYVVDGSVVERLAVDLGHRSGKVGFLLCTVTDDHHFVERLLVFRKSNFERCTFPRHFLGGEAHVGDNQGGILGHVGQCKTSVHVGDGTVMCTFHKNRRSDNGFSVGVDNGTCTLVRDLFDGVYALHVRRCR